jgi:hypothetical protein
MLEQDRRAGFKKTKNHRIHSGLGNRYCSKSNVADPEPVEPQHFAEAGAEIVGELKLYTVLTKPSPF